MPNMITVQVDAKLLAELDKIVSEVGLGPRSAHVRKALDEYIKRYGTLQSPQADQETAPAR